MKQALTNNRISNDVLFRKRKPLERLEELKWFILN